LFSTKSVATLLSISPYPEVMATGRGYERKGDPFTLKVERGEGPRCAIQWAKQSTGRVYFTRVPVHRCERLDAVTVAQAMRECAGQLSERHGKQVEAAWLAEHFCCDWHPAAQRVRLRLSTQPRELRAEVRLKVEVTPTGPGGNGARYWLTCPGCSRRSGVLYASPWGQYGAKMPGDLVTGCRACLGLTDEARQRHKCLDWAGAVIGSRPYRNGGGVCISGAQRER
jgi:hypothetical protein